MAPKSNALRLLSYARVSAVRGREGPSFISEADQFSRNRNYAKTYGHRIVEQDSDLDISGGVMTRPTFDRFLGMIEAGEADGIIVAKLDRFARSNVGALAAVEAIESSGGTLISVAEQLDASTGAGRFLRSILFAAAQWERERIGEAWYVARSSAVERGIHVAPHVPPGYIRAPQSNDPETDRRLSPHPVHGQTIREAFDMAARGARDSEIARHLNERELPSYSIKDGERATYWQASRIPRLLANRAYLGEARSGEGNVNEVAHKPLVDEDTFLLAQRGRSSEQELRRPNRNAKAPPSILSGIVRCAGCSFAMKPQDAGKTSPALYRCVKTSVHGVCPSPSVITKTKVESYVIDQFVAHYDAELRSAAGVQDEATADWQRLLLEADAARGSYERALVNVELRASVGDVDHDKLLAALRDEWQRKVKTADDARPSRASDAIELPEGVSLGSLVERLRAEGRNEQLRELLGEGVEAVFVRRAPSRARNLPASERVKVVFRGAERLDLPRRGARFTPQAHIW
jgi:site-specific DNA recombinase